MTRLVHSKTVSRCTMATLLCGLLLIACRGVVVPPGEPAERAKAATAEGTFSVPVNKRPLPDLATSASLAAVLEYVFNSNGDLEAAYREWRATIERVPQAGALPDPRLEFSFLFGSENMKTFGTQLDTIQAMLRQELPGWGKRKARAELALSEAQAVGERFRAAKFHLQKQVLQAYIDLALNDALIRLTSDTLQLLGNTHEVAIHRFHAMKEKGLGEDLSDLRKIEMEIQTVESEQRSLRIASAGNLAELNGVLNRRPDSPVGARSLPRIERPAQPDADLFARAVWRNPELAALRREVEARGAAQVLAELEKRPDFMIGAGLESKLIPSTQIMPMLSGGISLPVNRARIRAGIAEALAMRQAAEARLRAASYDVQARIVIALAGLRDAERILSDYQERIIPKTHELLQTQMTTYGSGGGDLLDILDTERLLVDFRKLTLRAEADRLRYLAELEEVMGEDLFGFVPATSKAQEAGP